MIDDNELLLRYAEQSSESAFAELVRRHLGLVYHAALRQVDGDAHRAQDVAQTVFTDLARKAALLARRPVLVGWLYTSTRYAAAQVVRGERRRRTREQAAHTMSEILSDAAPATEWERMRPVIDDALHALHEHDREAVLMRFFEGCPFAEIGARLSASEDAVRMRVDRALEKMRVELGRRGVTSTTAALAVALAGQTAVAAPTGLATTITGTALAGAASGGLAALTFMSMTKIQLGLAAGLVVAGTTGFVWQARTNANLRTELQQLQQENQQVAILQAENLRLARIDAEVKAMRTDDTALVELSDEAGALKGRMQAVARRAAEAKASKAVYDARVVDRVPRLRASPAPVYPAEMKQAGVGGEVVIDFVVDSSGKVRGSYVVRSSQREFEAPAVEAVSKWEFDPGQRGGRSVNTHMQVPIVFSLAKGEAEAGAPAPYSEEKKP